MEVGTILAIVSLVGSIVGSVDKFISIFDSLQNAPKEVRDFRVSAARLQRHFTAFQASLEASGSTLLHSDDVQEIEETLILCGELFKEHEAAFTNQGVLNGVLRATWTVRSSQKLTRYNAKIYRHYQQIILPVWVASMSSGHPVAVSTSEQADLSTSERPFVEAQADQHAHQTTDESDTTIPVVPVEDIELLTEGITKLKATNNRDVTEKTFLDLDRTLQRCWTQLGLPVDEIYDNAGLTDRRRASIQMYKMAPTTLVLENEKVPEQHRRLKLDRVHIMARDDQSRILQYQNHDASIHVTHIIPYGSIPWTEEKDSKRVSFLTAHVITVVDSEGYHLYHIDPRYKFKELETCREFQSTLRERKLLDAFMSVEIRQAGTITSRRQVIRFWRREFSERRPTVTMTYLETSIRDGQKHKEFDLGKFIQDPKFVIPRIPWIGGRSETLEVSSVVLPMSLRIKFEKIADATEFKETYKTVHPANQPAPQLELAYFSSASASMSATPAPTPSDATWNTGQPPSDSSVFSLDTNPDDYWSPVLAPMESPSENG